MTASVSSGAAAPHPLWPVLALMSNALAWGLSWWPLRQLQAWGLHPLWATACFFVLGTALLLAWQPGAGRRLLRSPALWMLALASGGTNAAFNWAVTIGEVVRVVLLFYLMPLWAVFLARALLNERITRGALARVALAMAGAVLVLWPQDAQGWLALRGLPDVLGVLGGLSFALTNVWIKREAQQPAVDRALAMFVGCTLLPGAIALGLSWQGAAPWPPAPAAPWLLLALGQGLVFVAVNIALQYGMARLPVAVSSVVMLTEIVFASASAVWLGGETLQPRVLLGGLLIVAAALAAAWERPVH